MIINIMIIIIIILIIMIIIMIILRYQVWSRLEENGQINMKVAHYY